MNLSLTAEPTAQMSALGSRLLYIALALGALGLAWWGVDAARQRGPWLDEFWTLWLSQRDVPLSEVFQDRWLADLHPPLFSFTHWLAEPWAGDSIFRHRALNLLPLGVAVAFCCYVLARYPASAPAVVGMLLVWGSIGTSTEYFAELRSYFSQMVVLLVLTGSLIVVLDQPADFEADRDSGLLVWVAGATVTAFSINYLAAAVAGLLLVGATAALLLTGRRAWLTRLIITGIVALMPVVAFVLVQRSTLEEASDAYWVTATFPQAVMIGARVVRRAIVANEVAMVCVAVALCWSVWGVVRRQRGGTRSDAGRGVRPEAGAAPLLLRQDLLAASVIGFALVVFAAIILAAHLKQPIVTGRYLLGWQVLVAGLVAVLAAPVWRRYPVLLLLMAVLAIGHQAATAHIVKEEARWNESLKFLQTELDACPASTVYAARFPRPSLMRHEADVRRWGHEHMARWSGIDLRFVNPAEQSLDPGSAECPTLVWIEHVNWRALDRTSDARKVLGYVGFRVDDLDLSQARTHVSDTGIVLVLPRP